MANPARLKLHLNVDGTVFRYSVKNGQDLAALPLAPSSCKKLLLRHSRFPAMDERPLTKTFFFVTPHSHSYPLRFISRIHYKLNKGKGVAKQTNKQTNT
jgi:hypothetical protein